MPQLPDHKSQATATHFKPRVSYLIVTKDRGEFLRLTLGNIREFIDPADELVIIDGGSADCTAAVIEENRDIINVFDSEPDFGEAHALNKAIYLSRGRYIKPIDDDDYIYPDAMRKLIEVIEAHPEIEAIQCGGEAWDMLGDQAAFDGFRFLPEDVAPEPYAIFAHALSGQGLIVRREAIERIGGVSSAYRAVDSDLVCSLIECGCNLRYLDIKLYKWHLRRHSTLNEVIANPHDMALINLRLGNWEDFMRQEPGLLLSLAKGRVDPKDRALAHWIWIAALVARSPLRHAYVPLYWMASRLLKLRQMIKGPPPGGTFDDKHQWTGRLR